MRGIFIHLHPILQLQKSSENTPIFAACLLSASSRGEGYYEKEAAGVEKAQDVNSNEVIWNQRDGAACNEEKIGAVIVECECNNKSDDTYKVRTREDDTEEQSKLPLHHRLQATQVFSK